MVTWLLQLADRLGGVVEAEAGGRRRAQQIYAPRETDWTLFDAPAYRRRAPRVGGADAVAVARAPA